MAKWIIAPTLMFVAFSSGWGQTKDTLVGTWKLISATDRQRRAKLLSPLAGFLTYTAEGRMIAIITFDGRKRLSVPDFISAPAQKRAEAFATMVAYSGRYTFAGEK